MPITVTRYSDDNIVTDLNGNEIREIRKIVDSTKRDDDISHRVTGGETYRDIAYINYGEAKYYYLICDYNNVTNPWEDPTPGKILRLPSMRKIIQGF
jgi:mRNA-degrading endonuclease HigB of HigAB toxin-antitoxin module